MDNITDNNQRRRTGTKEWSDHSRNIQIGCKHGCLYCYGRANAVRLKLVKDYDEWVNKPRPNKKHQMERPRKLKGRIMFPTTHDITEDNVDRCIEYLKKWLAVGNEFLIVSKPDPECIQKLINGLKPYKDRIMFRFTIGTMDDVVREFWEPNAPPINDRLITLLVAYKNGWQTSVSIEPYLDDTVIALVKDIQAWVTDTIWIGLMNKIPQRVRTQGWTDDEMRFLDKVRAVQTDEYVRLIYNTLKGYKKVRWKDSVKAVMGLPPEEVG